MRARGRAAALCLSLACLPGMGSAQAPAWPTPRDIDRALRERPFPAAGRLDAQPLPRPPFIDARPAEIDIAALAREGAKLPPSGAPSAHDTGLRVFITLDMPRASLLRLSEAAHRIGAVLVLRGLKAHSMRETLGTVRELIGRKPPTWIIDPQSFVRFGVTSAPTFVLATTERQVALASGGCASGCATASAFVSISGDVTIDYALETMARYRPELTNQLRPLVAKLRSAP